MRTKSSILIFTILTLLPLISIACKSPAKIVIDSLEIYPPLIALGEEAKVIAKIGNIGESKDSYNAILTVNGSIYKSQEIEICAGCSLPVLFSVTENQTGSYTIAVGDKKGKLEVRNSRAEGIELSHDGNTPDGPYLLGETPGIGYAVNFITPKKMTIIDLRFYGKLNNSGDPNNMCTVSIVDENFNKIYSRVFPETIFPKEPNWVIIPLNGITLDGDFFVELAPDPSVHSNIGLYYDSGLNNQYSGITKQDKLSEWNLTKLPVETTNWMIRVTGYITVP
jgi:hypothetical protein